MRNYRATLVWAQDAYQLIKGRDLIDTNLIRVFHLMGLAYHNLNQLDSAQYYTSKALAEVKDSKEQANILFGKVYLLQGRIFEDKRAFRTAKKYYNKALAIFELEEHTEKPRGLVFNQLGNIAILEDQLSKATEFYEKSLELKEAMLGRLNGFVAASYHNLGLVYLQQGRYEKAIDYVNYGIDIFVEIQGEHFDTKPEFYHSLGLITNVMGDKEASLTYFFEGLNAWKQRNKGQENFKLAYYLNNIGRTYITLDKPNKGITYLEKALRIRLKEFWSAQCPYGIHL